MARKYYQENNEAIPAICFEESKPVGFTLITNQAQLHDLIKGQYIQRAEDGADYYNDFRTDRYMDILNNIYNMLFYTQHISKDNEDHQHKHYTSLVLT